MSGIVEMKGAGFRYRQGGVSRWVIQDVNLCINKGDALILHGANGSGKSTLIKGILGLLPCGQGAISWHISRYRTGYVPQEPALDPDAPATALDVVCAAAGFSWNREIQACRDRLAMVGLREMAGVCFGRLSGGQKRRVLIARALVGNPDFIILDEPTVNVDQPTVKIIEGILMDLCAQKKIALLVSTHSADWELVGRRCTIAGGTLHG